MHSETANDLLHQRSISTGCDSIDHLLKGGFRCHFINEIYGASSTGKTQLCLQLLLETQVADNTGSACYIRTTDGAHIVSKRLQQLVAARDDHVSLDRIFMETAHDVDALVHILQYKLPALLEEHHVQLVVIDSIAGLFRGDAVDSIQDMGKRTNMLFTLANCMRILSSEYQAVFVVVNQVSMDEHSNSDQPALGLAWSSCVNQRLRLYRVHDQRYAQLVFSPCCPLGKTTFRIDNDGIHST